MIKFRSGIVGVDCCDGNLRLRGERSGEGALKWNANSPKRAVTWWQLVKFGLSAAPFCSSLITSKDMNKLQGEGNDRAGHARCFTNFLKRLVILGEMALDLSPSHTGR